MGRIEAWPHERPPFDTPRLRSALRADGFQIPTRVSTYGSAARKDLSPTTWQLNLRTTSSAEFLRHKRAALHLRIASNPMYNI